jgi:uncharacterized protein (TIGR00251 family)
VAKYPFCFSTAKGVCLKVHAQPNASKSEIVGQHGELLKIRIQAPPIDGKANAEIVRYLSEFFKISKSSVQVLKGDSSKQKTIVIVGVSLEDVESLLSKVC